MKKCVLLSAFVFCSIFLHATIIKQFQPGLMLEQNDDSYVIHFVMPDYIIDNDTIRDINDEYIFSSLKPYNDYFDHLDEDGRPTLPFYSMHLLLPYSGTWEVTDVQTQTTTIVLNQDYTPAQTHPLSDNVCSYDVAYYGAYNNQWYWDEYEAHETSYGHRRGLSFSLFPCHYEPSQRELTIVTTATYTIKCSDDIISTLTNILESDRLGINIYDNYITDLHEPYVAPIDGDEYLIITADQWESEPAFADFVAHKENLGYNVTVATLSDIGHSTPEAIRTYIRNQYNSCELRYVLLVGDEMDLPFSAGTMHSDYDPPTDVYYAALDESTISLQDCDITPDVYVGRWPIMDDDQLEYIVHKTMRSDTTLGYYSPNKVCLFSGDGSWNWYMYNDCVYLRDMLANFGGYTSVVYDGRASGINIYTMKNELEGNCDGLPWMFVYDGHGASNLLGSPYMFSSSYLDNDIINTSLATFQSFGFAFSCHVGDIFDSDNFARSWIGTPTGGVSFYAATTYSYPEPDRYLSRNIFGQLENKPVLTIGEFVANGAAKYYNANPMVWRRREMKKYVLYGDPSLYIFGLDYPGRIPRTFGLPAKWRVEESCIFMQNDDGIHISLEACDTTPTIQVYTITGQLMHSVTSYDIDLRGWSKGIYIVMIIGENSSYSQPIIIK